MNFEKNDNRTLIGALAQSPVFRKFERSFALATGLAVALVPLESWQLTFCGHPKENPFCALLSSCRNACAACLETQEKLATCASHMAQTVTCPARLSETAVPVRVGDKLIGFLRTGQIFQSVPSSKDIQHLKQLVERWRLPSNADKLLSVYLKTPVVVRKRYNGMIGLLELFAQQLAILSNQLVLQQAGAETEPPIIARARAFIEKHFSEPLSLREVAAASCISPFHFCKIFKRATGLTFTAFLARLRVEQAKNLLLNPNYRTCEIGFAVGFQSLSHFNRRFSEYVGESPTSYRRRMQRNARIGRKPADRAATSATSAFMNGAAGRGSSFPAEPTSQVISSNSFMLRNGTQPAAAGKRVA